MSTARVLLGEQLRPLWAELTDSPGWPTPATSMAINALIGLAGVWWLAAQSVRPRKMRGLIGLAIIGLLACGLIGSFAAAANKAAARNASVQLLGLVLTFWLLLQLLDSKRMRQAALICLFTAGAVFAVRALDQALIENPRFIREDWPRERERFFAERGWEPDSPAAKQFEERVFSAEVRGFALNANVAAAALLLVTLAMLGWSAQKWCAPDAPLRRLMAVAALVPASLAGGALLLTGSRGGIAAGAFGLLLFIGALLARHRGPGFRKRAVAALACLFAAATVAAAVFCFTFRQSSPDSFWYRNGAAQSLLIRWHYWTGAARVFAEQPLTGVGAGNFRSAYLMHKSPEALEQAQYPHNFAVTAFTEFGLVGGLAFLGLIGWVLWRVGRLWIAGEATDRTAKRGRAGRATAALAIAFPAGLLVLLVLVPTLTDPSATRLASQLATHLFGIVLAGPIVLMLAVARDRVDWPEWLGEGWSAVGIGCGLLAFLLACTIDFAMFQAGPAALFWSLSAVAMASSPCVQPVASGYASLTRVRYAFAAFAAIIVLAAYLVAVCQPVVRAEAAMAKVARSGGAEAVLATGRVDRLPASWLTAVNADELDPTIPQQLAEDLVRAANSAGPGVSGWTRAGAVELAAGLALRAAERDERMSSAYALAGQSLLAVVTEPEMKDYAVSLLQRAVKLEPTSVQLWEQYGRGLMAAGRPAPAADALAEAIRLDDVIGRYDPKGLFKLGPAGRRRLEEALAAARAATTQPAMTHSREAARGQGVIALRRAPASPSWDSGTGL